MKSKLQITPVTFIAALACLLVGYSLGRILEKRETARMQEALRDERMQRQQLIRQAAISMHETRTYQIKADYSDRQAAVYRSQLQKAHVPFRTEPDDRPDVKR